MAAANAGGMTVIRVQGAVGGVGASALAWALARAVGGMALDFSHHQGGLAWATGAGSPAAGMWPEIAGDEYELADLLAAAGRQSGAGWLSGGRPPDPFAAEQLIAHLQAQQLVVLDGDPGCRLPDAIRVCVATNQPRALEALDGLRRHALFARLQPGGVPAEFLMFGESDEQVFTCKQESSVQRALDLGMGVPATSRFNRVAKQLCVWSADRG